VKFCPSYLTAVLFDQSFLYVPKLLVNGALLLGLLRALDRIE